VRLVLNQIGRRLTEDLHAKGRRQRMLMMLDEFPALGRLDFFESALAFMAGYGIKAFLIAQSLNQIEKAYGPNNSILDNCHVRVSFATNDERTAKRVSDSLGTATEMRAMQNYAGHRLAPWLAHIMVSRQETARALMTPGEIMQLPSDEEIVMIAGVPPIRTKKARYFEDARLNERVLPVPEVFNSDVPPKADDWSVLKPILVPAVTGSGAAKGQAVRSEAIMEDTDSANAGLRREPGLDRHKDIAPEPVRGPINEFDPDNDEPDADAVADRMLVRSMRNVARQVSMDPGDGMEL
jgi:type IV secretion system protein VirD4